MYNYYYFLLDCKIKHYRATSRQENKTLKTMDDFRCADIMLSLSSAKSQDESNSLVENATSLDGTNAPSKELKNAVLNLFFVEMQSAISSRDAKWQDTH
jgi:hypothetical protein